MTENNVVSITSNGKRLLSTIRRIVKDSDNVEWPTKDHLVEEVAMSQIWRCLEKGVLNGMPKQNEFKQTYCELTHLTGGQQIYVALIVDTQNLKVEILHVEG